MSDRERPRNRETAQPRNLAFDPDAAATEHSGIYGLPHTPDEAGVVIIPVPFEATTSYGGGTSGGPRAVFEASKQVDLFDHETGRPYEAGIAMLDVPKKIVSWNAKATKTKSLKRVNEFGDRVNEWVYTQTCALLDAGKMAVTLGGDHSVPFGAIRAYAERHPGLGILHLDAHADLREAYAGHTWSHASIFHNVMTRIDAVGRLVQVGVRDLGGAEKRMIDGSAGRIVTFYDPDLAAQKEGGRSWGSIADHIVAHLPETVYLSWDIDGLDPTLCPSTGTPVPGGLSWNEAVGLLRAVVRAGKRVVGLDLCEVAPGDSEWDANVGARLLYKMIGFALLSQRA